MAHEKIDQRNIRKIQKDGKGSVRMTLPIEIVRQLHWRDGQKVVVKKQGKAILIEDWKG